MGKVMDNSLVLLTPVFLIGLFLSSARVSANTEVIDTVALTVPIACTLGGEGANTHNATINPGTYSGASGSEYENGIGKTTLTALCNDANGFSIYAIGFTGDSYVSSNHTKLVGQNTNQAIATKTYAPGDASSNWSMKLTKVENPASGDPVTYNPNNMTITGSFDNWHIIPNTYTKVAEYHSSTTDPSTTDTILGAKLETTYAAYISTNQVADLYQGQVKYTMVHPYTEEALQPQPTTPGRFKYYANAPAIQGTMGNQSVTDGSTVTLYASNFSRPGYGFAGWSDSFDYATNPNANFYGPMEDITVPTGSTANGLNLYAVWVKSEGFLQDSAKVSQICNRLVKSGPNVTRTLNSVSALTDQRDNETYAIAKLADDKCWIIENLRLNNTAANNSDGRLAQGYASSATYGNFSGLAAPESPWYSANSPNSLYSMDGSNNTISIGSYSANNRFPRYNNQNIVSRANNTTNGNVNTYSYGNYYTWAAAIASTDQFEVNNVSLANTSICPSGWRLPKGGSKANESNNDFWTLIKVGLNNNVNPSNYNSDDYPFYTRDPEGTKISKAIRSYPNNFLYSGSVDSAINVRGSNGSYWTSTAHSNIRAYAIDLIWDSVRPGTDNYYKHVGRPIRCIAINNN